MIAQAQGGMELLSDVLVSWVGVATGKEAQSVLGTEQRMETRKSSPGLANIQHIYFNF